MKFETEELSGFLEILSNLVSINTSTQHSNSLIESFLSELVRYLKADSGYIYFEAQLPTGLMTQISKSIGLPVEQCSFVNQYSLKQFHQANVKTNIKQYLFQLDNIGNQRFKQEPLIYLKTIIIVPIHSNNLENGNLSFYFDERSNLDNNQLGLLSNFGKIVYESYLSKLALKSYVERDSNRFDYFAKLYESVIILNEELNIIDGNDLGRNLLGKAFIENKSVISLADYLEPEDFAEVAEILHKLSENERSETILVDWLTLNIDNSYSEFKLRFGFTKFRDQYNKIIYIASSRIQKVDAVYTKDSLRNLSMSQNLVGKLSTYKESYMQNPKATLELIKEEIFPSSMVFLVNEETGPQPLAASPEIDLIYLMKDIIPLMSALNTEKMIAQHYITGSAPWSQPDGELRWISFVRENDAARGFVEIHLIGIVVHRDLETLMPRFIQILLGTLLGGMNRYLEILQEDEADFVTTAFNHDRNFSTVSLIKNSLEEMRETVSEIFAATLTGNTVIDN